MRRPILEVIALDARDAEAAETGGADRIEVVEDMGRGGLTPSPATVAAISARCSLPLRVMLRSNGGYATTPEELDRLAAIATELPDADGFVFGFLSATGEIDVPATSLLASAIGSRPWTFHRAIDHASDPAAAWAVIRRLPGLSSVLTSGSPAGVAEGLESLRTRAMSGDGSVVLAGGGLRMEHVPVLMAYGVRAFHVGSAVRPGGWGTPVDRRLVAEWRIQLDARQPPS